MITKYDLESNLSGLDRVIVKSNNYIIVEFNAADDNDRHFEAISFLVNLETRTYNNTRCSAVGFQNTTRCLEAYHRAYCFIKHFNLKHPFDK